MWTPWTVLVTALSAYSAARSPSAFSSPSGIRWQSSARGRILRHTASQEARNQGGRPRRVPRSARDVRRHAGRAAGRGDRPRPRERSAERLRATTRRRRRVLHPPQRVRAAASEADGRARRGRRPVDLLAEGLLGSPDRHHRGRRARRRRRQRAWSTTRCARSTRPGPGCASSTAATIAPQSRLRGAPSPRHTSMRSVPASSGYASSRTPARLAAVAFRPAAGTRFVAAPRPVAGRLL